MGRLPRRGAADDEAFRLSLLELDSRGPLERVDGAAQAGEGTVGNQASSGQHRVDAGSRSDVHRGHMEAAKVDMTVARFVLA